MFGWLLGRAMCLLEVGTDGVGAPGKPKKKKKRKGRKEGNVYNENEFEDSGENNLAWFYF